MILLGSASNAEVLLGVVNHGLMISFITLTCTGGQQLNKQYDHNDFQVDVPDSIGVLYTCRYFQIIYFKIFKIQIIIEILTKQIN
jgi:hypothetical protein